MRAPLHLIACCAGKADHVLPARELYTSDLFRKSVAYVEALGAPWAILSAKHGLVMPDQEVAPYDRILNGMNPRERRFWGEWVTDQLADLTHQRPELVFLAGRAYRDPITSSMRWRQLGLRATAPMEGLGIGYQRQWLAQNTPAPTTRKEP